MDTDRPDQTESPVIVKKRQLQDELGVNIEREKKLNTFIHPATLWKYGVSKRFKFRLITKFVSTQTPVIIPFGNEIITGLLPIQVGGKLSLPKKEDYFRKLR